MKPESRLLFSEFPSAGYTDWKKAAQQELNNQDPETTLAWQVADLQGKPYYDSAPFILHAGPVPASITLPQVTVLQTSQANSLALQHLRGGADGICFRFAATIQEITFHDLLTEIEWPWCHLAFLLQEPDESLVAALQNFLNEKKFDKHSLSGALYFQTFPHHPQVLHKLVHTVDEQRKLLPLGIVLPDGTFTESVARALAQATKLIIRLQAHHLPAEKTVPSITFATETGTDFFLEAARLRALRWLWFQIAQAFGIKNYQPADLFIHSISPAWNPERYHPHANLIKGTISAMAALAGNCNALTVIPEQEDDERLARIARNISLLLREESCFQQVSDPLAGSYYLENLTAQIAEKAWQKFQTLVRA
ncbi:MAG: hypothetical protein KatS3mg032_0483 [Cyclobacteriaceae bacterium]|nr:MAG: hypothetical protein KatS3mg032_0483 [Cyclobacteriaceae bacterium]